MDKRSERDIPDPIPIQTQLDALYRLLGITLCQCMTNQQTDGLYCNCLDGFLLDEESLLIPLLKQKYEGLA